MLIEHAANAVLCPQTGKLSFEINPLNHFLRQFIAVDECLPAGLRDKSVVQSWATDHYLHDKN